MAALLLVVALVGGFPPAHASPASLFQQPRYAAFLADADTGEILYARQADEERFPASITKVMTIYLLLERIAAGSMSLDDPITFSRVAASRPPTKLGIRAGDSITAEQAIRALATRSANDVAVAVAERLAGSEERFGELMTQRARQLGMRNTRFVNASGLPDSRQVTTARDIFILSRALIESFPQYYRYFQETEAQVAGQLLRSHNGLLRTTPGVDGIKTGFTRAAGFTLAASAVRDGRRLIAVVLGGPTRVARDSNVDALLNAGFSVLAARQRGNSFQVADLLAEPGDLNDYVLTSLVEQGSAEPPLTPRRR
jgi:D-alanyl-D-alanine carboxypeptidase (penicillin-binding protein 5/6)